MKKNTHPENNILNIKCSTCSKEHELFTTSKNVVVDVCSGCHSFFTGDKSTAKSTGRVDRFNKRASHKK